MDEDEEYVHFKVTSDDLEYELDPLRSFRKQTKDQAIYGIWSVEDEKAGGKRQDAKSYYKSVGVNFVSGGVTENKHDEGNDSGPEPGTSEDDVITDSENDDDDFRQVLSLSGPSNKSARDKNQERNKPSHHQSSSGPSRPSFGAVKSATAYRASNDFGNWEKYTKGIGYKLLDKMGYIPGKGLGRSNQGIVNPVAAKKRKGKAGVGAMGPEHENEEDFLGVNEGSSDKRGAGAKTAASAHKRQWRKTKQGEKNKVEYTYVTVEDLRKRAATTKTPDFSALANVKVIDRTGPQAKYLHGYDELARQYKKPPSDDEDALSEGEVAARGSLGSRAAFAGASATGGFHMPELVHNINKIVSSVEQQIIKADQTSLRSEDKMVHLKYEEERLGKQYNEEEEEIDRLNDVIRHIQDICISEKCSQLPAADVSFLESDLMEPQMRLKQITERFHSLKRQFASEFVLYELHNLTVPLVFPKVKAAIASWDITVSQTSPLKEFEIWKEILNDNRETQNMYAHMIWDFWMPKIRRFILSGNIRESEKLIELLENWSPIIPSNIFINLTEQFLIPRLQTELDAWNPVTDVVPVHSWIHPWLPLMGERLQPLYVTIRAKLANCLVNWDPTDRSAKLIIEPWRDVFAKGEMEAFLIKAICPKLKMALHLMPIDSSNTGIEILRSVLLWHDLLSQHQMSQILVTHFFPKWISTLCAWLSNSPNFEQVEKWYRAWRNEFPVHILAINSVKLSFKQAMDILNRAVSGAPVSGMQYVCPEATGSSVIQQPKVASGNPTYMPASAVDGYVPQSILNLQRQSGLDSSSSMMQLDTFRDLVERRCAELNLLFAPVPGVFHDSKQVYSLGSLKVCIDKGVIFVNRGGGGTKWQPMSLPAVLSHARDR